METSLLSKDVLLKLMEQSYKLSWINYEESTKGWLPEVAYNIKYSLEAELSKLVMGALEELIQSYEKWMEAYKNYARKITELLKDVPDSLYSARLDEMQKVVDIMRQMKNRDYLIDKINALQLGLLNAYHDSSLVKLLDLPSNAEDFLNRLYVEPFVAAWNSDLEKVLYREPGQIKNEKAVSIFAHVLSYVDLFLTTALVNEHETKNSTVGEEVRPPLE